jgi:CheY-like chemotaxis protein
MQSKKVLIVDDDSKNIFALKATLTSRGYQCLTATNAMEGIRILQTEPGIKVVLLDMMMPDVDGYQAISIIRKDRSIAHIPVIAVTAQAMVGDKEKCLQAGADDYISKPINVDILFNQLDKVLITKGGNEEGK